MEFTTKHDHARIIPVHTIHNKNKRILQAFDPILAARALSVHQSVMDQGFADDLRQFNPSHTRNRDDTLDAVCGALTAQPVRLPRILSHASPPISSPAPRPLWQTSARPYQANIPSFTL